MLCESILTGNTMSTYTFLPPQNMKKKIEHIIIFNNADKKMPAFTTSI